MKRARTMTVVLLVLVAFGLPMGSGTGALAATSLTVPASSDAWLNKLKPKNNYGAVATLRADAGEAETVLKFSVSAWSGKQIASLALTVRNISGDGSGLVIDRTEGGWKESTVNWGLRPRTIATIAQAGSTSTVVGGTSQFDVKSAFPSGVVDRSTVWLRIRNIKTNLVTFGSSESTSKPALTLVAADQEAPTKMKPISDTWVGSAAPTSTHAGATYLLVDGQSKAEAYLKFDVSKWRDKKYSSLRLQIKVRTAGGTGVSVSRVGAAWKDSTLTWKARPASMGTLASLPGAPSAGMLQIDLSSAFAGGLISADTFAVRIATTNSRGFDFSSREGPTAAILEITPEVAVLPTATPTPTQSPTLTPAPTATPLAPSPSPTIVPSPTVDPSASVCPTQIPTPTPMPTDTPAPTATPTTEPTPDPSPTPTGPLFYFYGHGTDHGVGMSQWGAKGRAQAGQTYDQILTFYYTGVDFSTIDGSQPIRVRLGDSFWPTATKPARVTGYIGGWQSASFPGMTFPQGSYVQMVPPPAPPPDPCGVVPDPTPTPTVTEPWTATAYDATGAVLATTTTTDLTVEATDPEGVLWMAFRDEQSGYRTYRGKMRMLVTNSGLQTVNILPMEQYLRGVVPAESPASWPIEAVKAQAVAARTYAWQRMKPNGTWDVLPDSANQNYGGYQHERVRSDDAVLATANQVLTYHGEVISAVYHSASGGYTENSEFSFTNSRGDPGNIVGYLRGKPDVDENGIPYDINTGSYDWNSGQFTMAQLSAIFARNAQTNVGEIYSIDITRGVSGRAYRVVLTGSEGTKQVSGGRFKNIYNDNKLSGAKLLSAMFYLEPVPPPIVP